MSLTGNQLYTDVNAGKTNWRIQGKENATLSPFAPATNFSVIDLPQQRIRMFNVTYIVAVNQTRGQSEEE